MEFEWMSFTSMDHFILFYAFYEGLCTSKNREGFCSHQGCLLWSIVKHCTPRYYHQAFSTWSSMLDVIAVVICHHDASFQLSIESLRIECNFSDHHRDCSLYATDCNRGHSGFFPILSRSLFPLSLVATFTLLVTLCWCAGLFHAWFESWTASARYWWSTRIIVPSWWCPTNVYCICRCTVAVNSRRFIIMQRLLQMTTLIVKSSFFFYLHWRFHTLDDKLVRNTFCITCFCYNVLSSFVRCHIFAE